MVLYDLFNFLKTQISNVFSKNNDNNLEQTQISNDDEEEEEATRYMVPEDVIIKHILPLIPIKPLTQFMLVSKEWYSLISSSKFMLNHFKLSLFDDNLYSPINYLFIQIGNLFSCFYNVKNAEKNGGDFGSANLMYSFDNANFNVGVHKINFVGNCCNGLFCFGELHGKFFILWNPFIGKFHRFYPHDFALLLKSTLYCAWGFGYVSSLDDHKVVMIMLNFGYGYVVSRVYVYSLKSNRWKKIEFGLEEVVTGKFGRSKVVDETVYWTMSCNSTGVTKIIAFDLVSEKFYAFPHLSPNLENEFLCVLGGCLGVCGTNLQNDLMLTVYKKSCTRVASVRLASDANKSRFDDVIGFTKMGNIFVVRNDPKRLDLVAYPGLNNCKSLVLYRNGPDSIDVQVRVENYVRSEVSPVPKGELPNESEPVPYGRVNINLDRVVSNNCRLWNCC